MTANVSERHIWIDIAKGLGVLLVLFGHLPISKALIQIVHSFNMPCFFFMSGLVFKHTAGFIPLVKNKLQHIIKPYLLFSFLSYIAWLMMRPLSHTMSIARPWNTFWSIFYGTNTTNYYMAHNMPLWFLPCLFVTLLLFYGYTKLSARHHALLAVAGVGLSLILASLPIDVRLPWSADVALMAVGFMSTGYLYRQRILTDKPLPVIIILILFSVTIVAASLNSFVDMNYNHYGYFALFLVSASCGIMAVTNTAKRLQKYKSLTRLLGYIGKNSLYILGFHWVAFMIISGLINRGDTLLHLHLSMFDEPTETMNLLKWVEMSGYMLTSLWFSRRIKRTLSPALKL